MKVLHIFNELKYSGAEIMYVDAAPLFQEMGCELYVVNTFENLGEFAPAFRDAGYEVYHRPFQFRKREVRKRIEWMNQMVSLIRELKIDIVHIHAARLRGIMSYVAWRSGVRCVYTFHNVFKPGSAVGFVRGYLERWSAKNIFRCKFQTISDSVFNNEKDVWHDKTTLVYNWYGKSRFYPAMVGEKAQRRKALGYADDQLVIVSVGGCSHVKRHTDVIKALPILLKKGIKVIYQHLGEGAALDEEKQLAESLGVDDCIRFLGNKRNVRDYLIASDIYVMPSRYEGIPITTIEAMACKIPCVLYNVPGLRDFNKESECSRLIPESHELLADTVAELYADRQEQNRLSENGYNYITKYFDMDKNAMKIFALYQPTGGGKIVVFRLAAAFEERRAA